MRVRTNLALALAAVSVSSCEAREDIRDVPSQPTALIGHVPAHLRLTSLAESPAAHCRIVVITTTDCGVASALAQDWVEEIESLGDSLSLAVDTHWIVYGPAREDARLFALTSGRRPSITRRQGGDLEMQRALDARGSPHTLVMGRGDTVRAVISGNALPDAVMLKNACQ
jgi:hypothetical protein